MEAQSVLRKHMAGRCSKCSRLLFLLDFVCEEREFSPVRKAALSTGFVGSSTPGDWTSVRNEMETAAPLGPGQGCYCSFLWLMWKKPTLESFSHSLATSYFSSSTECLK